MYCIAIIWLESGPGGIEERFQVGADVDENYMGRGYDVSEPDVSAPDCALADAVITTAALEALPDGWSEMAEEALSLRLADKLEASECGRADYDYDRWNDSLQDGNF